MVDTPLSLITRTDLVMCFISFSAPPSLPPSLPPPNTSSLRDPFNSLASLPLRRVLRSVDPPASEVETKQPSYLL